MTTIERLQIVLALLVLTGLLGAHLAQAADCSGYDVFVSQAAETTEVTKGHSLMAVRSYSVVITDDPKNKFNLTTGECSGTLLNTPDGKTKGSGHCARKDKDGDTYSIEWQLPAGADKGAWKTVAGTGKFKTATSNAGWFQSVGADGKMSMNRWGGTCE